ncbi:RAB6A-GEF complex partner protein 2-like [Limulus polyphemus]|uniref:RAB6A-GEF complex partner protein 2-like n=1 Tax=Limulus polyphemus TaxID=6850 RepID=A0ABM1B6D7_LIMPO|nr:RAB6A-GEF complex partner protein 2-like [Limulus polyphemus]XP_013775731.1 RAB6A-GEF complex partner protein 2-like [Limulus polyphemus]
MEVHASLSRGSVFLAGETIECLVTFRNPCTESDSSQHETNGDLVENLAWASAQIHCQCSVDEIKVKFPASSSVSQEELATASQETSFIPSRGEKGHVVLSTEPKILFCDLKLRPGESKTYIYKEIIPSNAPPSYRGQNVKYVYKVTIGTQRVNAVIKLLRIPLKVLVFPGLPDVHFQSAGEEVQVAPSNPFLEVEKKESYLELVLQVLENITARRKPSVYNVTNQDGKVVKFCLVKSAFRLGEDIIGTLDFSEGTVPCVQFLVTLQSEEEVQPECSRGSKALVSTVSYTKHHEFCLHLQHTHMLLPIPLTITPSFSSDIVSLKWKLHFEFVTTNTSFPELLVPSDPSDSVTLQGPESLDVQTMVWDLPIKIFPTHPVQVANGIQSTSHSSISIT